MRTLPVFIAGLLCLSCSLAHGQTAPQYEVDAFWPEDLPNKWVLGHIRGLAVDRHDHIWVLNDGVPSDNAAAAKNPPEAECCIPAPFVIELDPSGKVVRSWGKPGFVPGWPSAPRGIHADSKGNIWITGVASPWNSEPASAHPTEKEPWDRHILKFSGDGKLLLQIGKSSNAPLNNHDPALLGPIGAVHVDDAANELYVADGFAQRRIVVLDANTGAFKRGWGAYGIPLEQIDNSRPAMFPVTRDPKAKPSKQFSGLTDIEIANDGSVYAADQMNYRIQVFNKQGRFIEEFPVAPKVLGFEATWSMDLSHDPQQRYLFVTDGESGVIRMLNRADGAELGKLGHKGRNAGQFSNLGWIAFDSRGVLYTGEVHFARSWDGKTAARTGKPQSPGGRLQRFVLKR